MKCCMSYLDMLYLPVSEQFPVMSYEHGYFRVPGRGGKIHKNALNFFFSCRTAMRQRASERSTLQHSPKMFFVVIGCFLTFLSWFKVTRFVKNDVIFSFFNYQLQN